MVGSQDVIPIYQGWRFHDCTPLGFFSAWLLAFGRGLEGLKAKTRRSIGVAGMLTSIGTAG